MNVPAERAIELSLRSTEAVRRTLRRIMIWPKYAVRAETMILMFHLLIFFVPNPVLCQMTFLVLSCWIISFLFLALSCTIIACSAGMMMRRHVLQCMEDGGRGYAYHLQHESFLFCFNVSVAAGTRLRHRTGDMTSRHSPIDFLCCAKIFTKHWKASL